MKKYYLFIIKPDAFNLYKNNSEILYLVLNDLYKLDSRNLVYGISLFHQLCETINVKLLQNYIIEKIPHIKINNKIFKILSFFEKTYIEINYSSIIVLTDIEIPQILKTLNIYNRQMFVVDFENKKYFWLQKELIKNSKQN